MPDISASLPPKNSTDWYGHYSAQDATVRATPGSTYDSPLSRFYAGLAIRDTAPAYIVFNGDSNTEYGNTSNSRSYVSHFAYKIQAEYPLIAGGSPIAPTNLAGATSNLPGIRVVNNGHAGATSANYLTDAEVSSIAALKPIMVVHAPGTNDAYGATKATVKANIQSWVTKIKNASTRPTLQVLFLIQARGDTQTIDLARWKEYGQAMAEIAASDPNNVIFVDASGAFLRNNVPGSDPFGLMSSDKLHNSNAGWALLADVLWGALQPQTTVNYVQQFAGIPVMSTTTAPSITPSSATVGDTLTVSPGTYSPSPDSRTYQWRRAGVNISGATATTYVTVSADAGQAITVAETVVKAGYDNLTAVSASVTPAAAPGTQLTNSTAPAVAPTSATTGTVLTASNGTWSATPDSYTYQWRRGGTAISGATSSTYTVVSADLTNAIDCAVTAVKANYTSGTANSNSVTPVAASSWVRWTSDGFSGAASTNIQNRTTDIEFGGNPKTWKVNYANGYGVNGSGQMVRGSGTGSYLLAGFTLPTGSHRIEITVVALPTGNNEELHFKQTDAFTNTYYGLVIDKAGKTSLLRSVSGTVTYGLTPDIALASGNVLAVEWDESSGAIINVLINGVQKGQKDESAISPRPTGTDAYMATGANSVSTYDALKIDTK